MKAFPVKSEPHILQASDQKYRMTSKTVACMTLHAQALPLETSFPYGKFQWQI